MMTCCAVQPACPLFRPSPEVERHQLIGDTLYAGQPLKVHHAAGADLPHVRDYQLAKLAAAKAPYPNLAPQAMMAATEQGWTTSTDANTCEPSRNSHHLQLCKQISL